MSLTNNGPEAQDSLFSGSPPPPSYSSAPVYTPAPLEHSEHTNHPVPAHLERATARLDFTPSYAIVGVYRLFTDQLLWKPAWDKCRHAARRGAIVGTIWAVLTFSIQRAFIQLFLSKSPRITGLSQDTMFGLPLPFTVQTYATVIFVSSQVTQIMQFFLRRNIRIARDRVWDQTVASRGKGPDFWQPYIEEWSNPPRITVDSKHQRFVKKWLGGWFGMFVFKNILLSPFQIYPFVGIAVTAWFKALGTAHILHRRYFESKNMTETQVATFMEERKWDYRAFGFTAALLEGLPIIGLVFTVSNRVGAAMWAHDLEKRQHFVAAEKAAGRFGASKKD